MKKHNPALYKQVQFLFKTVAMTILLQFSTTNLHAQANAWVLNPTLLDFGAAPAPFTISAPTPYVVENSVFWNGKLQFYVSDGFVYDAAGNQAGQYSLNGYGLKEVAIAPGPGSCNTWCLFWLEVSPLATLQFFYQEVVVDQTTGAVSFGPYGEVAPNTMFGTGGIAVSKVTGGTGERDIYIVTPYAVNRFHLSGLGVAFVSQTPYTQGGSAFICEADLSPDGSQLTWGSNNKVYKMTLGGAVTSITVGKGGSKIQGVEFSADGNSIYYCHSTKGIERWRHNDLPPNIDPLTEGGGSYTRTQLELAKNGYIYAVRDDGVLGRIQGLAVQATSTIVSSDSPPPTGGSYFGLPDQVDGEDYNQWVGVPPVAINSYQVNGQVVYDFIDATHPPLLVYNCAPINLETALGGIITGYSLQVYSTDPVTGLQITGPGYLNYSGTFVGSPPSSIDLRCLTGAGCSLFNAAIAAGHFTFAVRLTIENRCGSTSKLGHIKVFSAPVDAQAGLQVNNTLTGIPCPASHNPSAPCPAGIYSASINLSNSQGDISYYQLTIDEVSCSTGALIANVYTGAQVPVSGVSGLTALALNGLTINGNTGYFANPAWLGRCLKITAVVGNVCGSSSDYTYLNFNGQYFDDPNTEGRESASEQSAIAVTKSLLAYPNPFSDKLNISFSLGQASVTDLAVVDATGRIIIRPLSRSFLETGTHTLDVETETWPAGLYTLRLITSAGTESTSIVKVIR